MKTLFSRLSAPTPAWFKGLAWVFGIIAVAGGAVLALDVQFAPQVHDWIKIVTAVSTAIATVSMTAKDDSKAP